MRRDSSGVCPHQVQSKLVRSLMSSLRATTIESDSGCVCSNLCPPPLTPSNWLLGETTAAAVVQPLSQAPVVHGESQVCEKDASCFDVVHPCNSCCSTSLNLIQASCWDPVYTHQRCCRSTPPSPTAAPTQVPTTPTPEDCFDAFVQQCSVWASIGECSGSAGAYVRTRCPCACSGKR